MADAPAGGSGWGALEIILAIVLGIGLIATLTGTPITPLIGGPTASTKTKTAAPTTTEYDLGGCTLVFTRPTPSESIDTSVTVEGGVTTCLNDGALPTFLNAQVVDSKGSILSDLTQLDISKSLFGDVTVSATIPLSGVARSTSATVIISGTTATTGKTIAIRIPIKLIARTNPTPIVTSGFNNTSTDAPASYTAPAYIAPTPVLVHPAPQTTTSPTSSGSGGTTF